MEETDKLNCVLVTIGIGGDILSEEKLKDRLPKCRLYGADPINASGEIYTKVGKYYQLAVSDVSGSKLANVLTNPEKIFTYSVAKVPHISFKDFLQIKANVNVVDFLFLDGEGSEYKILPQMQIGGELDRGNITICQLSVELHGPVEDYGFTKDQWDLFMRNFLLKSNYLPLWTPYPANHHRMFFVNYANRICIEKFFKYWC